MMRTKLKDMLVTYMPTHTEYTFKTEMLSFIEQHPNCFERSLAVGHITASSWLINHDNTSALLMHHAKLDRWLQLGGHCDGDPDVLAVAIKEAQEESGLTEIVPVSTEIFDIDIHLIPDTPKEKAHYHYDVRFLLQATKKDEPVIVNSESKSLVWISKDTSSIEFFKDNLSVVRLFNKWLLHSI